MSIGKSSISRAGKVAEKVIGNPDESLRFFAEPSAAPAVMPDDVKLEYVPLENILPTYDEEMITCAGTFDDVVESVKKYGILIPMLLRRVDTDKGPLLRIITGHKRFYAAHKLGLKTVPAQIIVCDDKTAALIYHETTRYDSRTKAMDSVSSRISSGDLQISDELPSYLL
ncbi:MAG: ParB N-terminal domain-containing protein [Clostridia bacterium]|nr:ParB N-terminal domain-containing protein [Clostridia bacterium]MCR5693768.1 ParB N-terminal domain-containing protein [Clostridia bacterium]